MPRPIRLTVVMTHPVQYFAPWFRHIAAQCPELDLTVLYATEPTPEQQGVGFGTPFRWDVPLTEGYRCRVLRPARPGDSVDSGRFWGIDVPEVGRAILDGRPDVVLLPGWHSVTLLRALWTCRRHGIPVLYRGDSHLGTAPGGWRRWLWTARTRALLRQFAGGLSVGTRARAYLERFGMRRSRIWDSPPCVDTELFSSAAVPHQTGDGRRAARAALGLAPAPGDFVVLLAGKLDEHKRPLDAVRAVARLGRGAALLVAGEGPLRGAVRAEADRLGVRLGDAGFLNQSELGRAYAAADCLALPSAGETWGLVVNEALATGLPCVVSDRVGCAPDLIEPGVTGEVFPTGDVDGLAAALDRVRGRAGSPAAARACRARAAALSFDRATEGLLAACRVLARRGPRVLACCGGMVIVSGLERMTFEVLRTLRERGAAVHCIVNSWENERIVALAERIGGTWSTGYYWYQFDRHTRNPVRWAQFSWDIARTSLGLLRDAWRFRPTHVLLPDFGAALRNAPALLLLRFLGVPIILRVANHPDAGSFYRHLWGRVLPRLVSRFAANSQFSANRLLEVGVPAERVVTIRNTVARRRCPAGADADAIALAASRRTILAVGQIAPFKGTHLVVEAMLALIRSGEDLQAVIVGARPAWPPERVEYLQALAERVRASGATDRIHFVGERENVLEIMRASWLLAAPILQEETFGNVALEAKSVGLPVVAFRSGGLLELVDHGVTGFLCAEPTLDGLLEGVRWFLADPGRRDKAAAASLAALAEPDSELSAAVFERRWRELVPQEGKP